MSETSVTNVPKKVLREILSVDQLGKEKRIEVTIGPHHVCKGCGHEIDPEYEDIVLHAGAGLFHLRCPKPIIRMS